MHVALDTTTLTDAQRDALALLVGTEVAQHLLGRRQLVVCNDVAQMLLDNFLTSPTPLESDPEGDVEVFEF